jgi:hypothetical protein
MTEEISKSNQALQIAWSRGYRVREDGSVYRLDGKPVRVGKSKKTGYRYIKIRSRKQGINHFARIHRLMAIQKFGLEKVLSDEVLVRHLDDVPGNNARSNIEIGSSFDNTMDMPVEKRIKRSLRAATFTRTVPVERIREIRLRHSSGESISSIARVFNMNKGKVSRIVNGIHYSTVV